MEKAESIRQAAVTGANVTINVLHQANNMIRDTQELLRIGQKFPIIGVAFTIITTIYDISFIFYHIVFFLDEGSFTALGFCGRHKIQYFKPDFI